MLTKKICIEYLQHNHYSDIHFIQGNEKTALMFGALDTQQHICIFEFAINTAGNITANLLNQKPTPVLH